LTEELEVIIDGDLPEESMLGPLLEVREFTCPKCGWKVKHHFYIRDDPSMTDCWECGAQYVWIHAQEALYTLQSPWELQKPEAFVLIQKND
jgi:predicted RNA-binding Zn-ribbon protein involved in translation (DUF1610 family)